MQTLSENELAVMTALWSGDGTLSRPEILRRITKTNWNPNSIHLVLNNLIKKGFVQAGDLARCGQSYGRTYRAMRTRGEYAAALALEASEGPEEARVLDVMNAIVRREGVGEETLRQLEALVARRRAELGLEDAGEEA